MEQFFIVRICDSCGRISRVEISKAKFDANAHVADRLGYPTIQGNEIIKEDVCRSCREGEDEHALYCNGCWGCMR